jgi:hypothetical protein
VVDAERMQVGEIPPDALLLRQAGSADRVTDRGAVSRGGVNRGPVGELMPGDQPLERGERAPLAAWLSVLDRDAQLPDPSVITEKSVDDVR